MTILNVSIRDNLPKWSHARRNPSPCDPGGQREKREVDSLPFTDDRGMRGCWYDWAIWVRRN